MTQTIESLFDQGIERYKAGEGPDTLIPVFKDVCDRSPKNGPALTCLAWLYLLADKPIKAHEMAQKAVKLNPQDAQARVNLALAMLDGSKKGVRPHIDVVQQLIMIDEVRTEIEQNIEDGLARKPDWPSMQRIKTWLFEG